MRAQTVWPGDVYGMLTVKQDSGQRQRGSRLWECLCECGGTTLVTTGNLRSGNSQSCGCRKRAVLGELTRVHGGSRTKPYGVYKAVGQRCNNPRHKDYGRYGGRGIEFRLPPFPEFWAAMGPTWFEGATIERIDNDGHYELGNVRWATRKEQAQNTTTALRITFKGETLSQSEWARRVGVSRKTMAERLQKWPLERALTEPSNR